MKLARNLIPPAILALLLFGAPEPGETRVAMSGMIHQTTGFTFNILETATFTVDDWLSNPNLWWVTIDNTATSPSDTLSVVEARIFVNIGSGLYPNIIENGTMYLVGNGARYYKKDPLRSGEKIIINNTIISGESNYMSAGKWSTKFRDEVLRIGYMPEGTYTLSFTLEGKYSNGQTFGTTDVDPIVATIDIKNPLPPELVTPENASDNVVTIPRFAWQEPQVSDLAALKKTIRVNYTLTLWKMFTETGATLTREEAIRRVPIWGKKGLVQPSVVFDPGTSREELVPGRKYCWQVQAFDGTGRFISAQNEGKSDIWEFSVKYSPTVLNEPILFYPLRFSWTAAQAGGAVLRYNVSVSEGQDFSRAYTTKGMLLTSFTYPSDAPALQPGKLYYIRIQATDERGIPIGIPTIGSFTIPTIEVTLVAPEDNAPVTTLTPTFRWQGSARSFVVTITQEGGRGTISSGKVDGTSWQYDGEDLKRGAVYSWNVAPANERGEAAGPPSASRKFTVPEETQITLSAPVNMVLETVFPTFTWNGIPRSDNAVSYVIDITTESGTAVHSATVTETTFAYPQNAPALSYGTKYLWSVRALRNGAEIGQRSGQAWFITPFVAATAGEPTLADISAAVKAVLADYPQFAPFRDMTATTIKDQNGPITTTQFLEMLDKYRIKSVSAK